jgi:hypothetical protein
VSLTSTSESALTVSNHSEKDMERIKHFGDREGLRERANRETKSALVQHPSLFQPQPQWESV